MNLLFLPTADSLGIRAAKRSRGARRAALVLLAFAFFVGGSVWAQNPTVTPMPDLSKDPGWFPNILKGYRQRSVPAPNLDNAAAISQLIQDGKLKLSIAQLTDVVMHDNLDIDTARYFRYYSQTDVLRAKSGAAPRGSAVVSIPSGLFSSALGAGIGSTVAGLVGAQGPAFNASGRSLSLSARGGYDGAISFGFSMDQTSTPLNSIALSGIANVLNHTLAFQSRYAQAFTSGTSFSVSFNSLRQSTTQNVIYSPAYVPSANVVVTQQLLSGFGFESNRRYLTVANMGRQIAREAFRQQVFTTLSQAQDSYWDMVAFQETVRAAEQALQVAQQLYENNKRQAEVGTLAPLDVTSAQSEVAGRKRDLIIAQTNLQKSQIQLKAMFSRNLTSDLADVPIETTDPLPEPQDGDIPGYDEALADSQRNRPELYQAEGNILNSNVAMKFSQDALRPELTLFGLLGTSSLFGDRLVPGFGISPGGWGSAITQLAQFKYPEYAFGLSLTIPIRNRGAQADNFRARLEEQQGESSLQRTRNQISLEVRDALIGMAQARAQVVAAHQATEFAKQTVDAEDKKLNAGTSTPYNLILVQRDLLTAQVAEVQARATYAKARVEMQRATGTLLEKNHVDPQEVPRGEIPLT